MAARLYRDKTGMKGCNTSSVTVFLSLPAQRDFWEKFGTIQIEPVALPVPNWPHHGPGASFLPWIHYHLFLSYLFFLICDKIFLFEITAKRKILLKRLLWSFAFAETTRSCQSDYIARVMWAFIIYIIVCTLFTLDTFCLIWTEISQSD